MTDESTILDSDEDETPEPKRRENSTIRQMREALEAKEASEKAALERATRLEQAFLSQSGLTEKQATALRGAGYDVSPEGINAFRQEVLGLTTEEPAVDSQDAGEEVPEDTTEEPEEASFTPTKTAGTPPVGKREVDSQGLLELMQSDPAKADKLLRSGRVVHKKFNPGGPAF